MLDVPLLGHRWQPAGSTKASHQQVTREEASQHPDGDLEHLDNIALVKVEVIYHQFDSLLELGHIAHNGEHVQAINEGKTVVSEDIIDVDIVRMIIVWTPAHAIQWIQFVQEREIREDTEKQWEERNKGKEEIKLNF